MNCPKCGSSQTTPRRGAYYDGQYLCWDCDTAWTPGWNDKYDVSCEYGQEFAELERESE